MKTLLVMDVIPLMDNAHHKEYNVAEANRRIAAMGVVHTSSGSARNAIRAYAIARSKRSS